MELASEITRKLVNEGVKRQMKQQEDIIRKIKDVSSGFASDVSGTETLSELSYQKFRRTLGEFLRKLNSVFQSFTKVNNNPQDADLTFNAFNNASDLINDWNQIVISLGLMNYYKLIVSDKNKVYDDIKTIKPRLINLRSFIDNNRNIFLIPDDLINAALRALNEILLQIDRNVYQSISPKFAYIPNI